MNDERAGFPHPSPSDAGGVRRVPAPRILRADQPAAGRCVLITTDVRAPDESPPVGRLELMLRMAGAATVHAVTDFTSANARCQELRPDLILIDASPGPGQDVLTSLREIVREQGFLPTVLLTGDTTAHTRDQALAAGAADVITKPCDELEFVERISNLLKMRALYRHVQDYNIVPHSGYDTSA